MPEYVTRNKVRIKATDALLDHILKARNETAMDTWKLSYLELLGEQMLNESEPDRTSMVHEMLFVIRGA